MTQPTPGRWEVVEPEEGKPYYKIRGTQLGCRFKIANVLFVEDTGLGEALQKRQKDEALANANLIVASKELYDHMRALLESTVPFTQIIGADPKLEFQVWRDQALALLNKVEGITK